MMYAGIKDVKILNGGLQSWLDAGYEITKETTKAVTKATIGIQIPVRPELAVDVPEAKRMIASNDAELVCVRSWPEYIGEVSGYNYIEKKGRIPGLFLEIVAPMPITWKITVIWIILPVSIVKL